MRELAYAIWEWYSMRYIDSIAGGDVMLFWESGAFCSLLIIDWSDVEGLFNQYGEDARICFYGEIPNNLFPCS